MLLADCAGKFSLHILGPSEQTLRDKSAPTTTEMYLKRALRDVKQPFGQLILAEAFLVELRMLHICFTFATHLFFESICCLLRFTSQVVESMLLADYCGKFSLLVSTTRPSELTLRDKSALTTTKMYL